MDYQYDIIIIGSGPGGYSAAVTAAQMGAKVCLVEKNELGGICVNRGCIPTKAMIASSSLYNKLKHSGNYGIKTGNVSVDYEKIISRTKDVASNVRRMIEQAVNANKIDIINGKAELVSENKVNPVRGRLAEGAATTALGRSVSNGVKVNDREINAKKIIIATGSRPKSIKGFGFDNKRFFSSEMFLDQKEFPKSVLIVGAGVIGCEWAGILAGLDVSVTLVEAQKKILPEEDDDLSRVIESSLKKMGVDIRLNSMAKDEGQEKVIVCVGRDPVAGGMNGVETKDGGWIKVNKYLQTNMPSVYAIGDVIGPPLLAYTAGKEGEIAARNALGKEEAIDYGFIPRVVFSMPELASVGLREHEAGNAASARAFFKGLGKAIADGETEGFIKIIYDKSDYKILGVGIAGKNASELINEPALALKDELTVREWAEKIWPHPVMSEIFGMALGKIK